MKTEDFFYDLPAEFIAQTPVEPRDHSRLMVLERETGRISHHRFFEIGQFLRPGDLLVVNETRVFPARFYGHKLPGGGKVEILLLKKLDDLIWECLVGGSGMKPGRQIQITEGPVAEVVEDLGESRRLVRFTEPIESAFDRAGHVPLPPYIHAYQGDPERYQTIFNKTPGSAAAPTAGLHFTPALLEKLRQKGVGLAKIDLHVGLDTFAPVTEEDPETHHIHKEWCAISAETAQLINQTRQNGGRVIAVGTTTVRTLESAAAHSQNGLLQAWQGDTSLFILPGFEFKAIDAMVTNFHLPKSTLLMLVSAFAGRDTMLNAYEVAKREAYRFFSFGDAMLLL
ncbi:MAG TPA: tRNA preQ1(34) S-adenosylmethionine ribosyltransferase-isomerase QueA [Anaerolineaceae bacterium]|nr:tRNA preQ1(34) S-adenosylmethionine ribosyltransferase-isomerase QueA [Anaerolineaceae bacterium]